MDQSPGPLAKTFRHVLVLTVAVCLGVGVAALVAGCSSSGSSGAAASASSALSKAGQSASSALASVASQAGAAASSAASQASASVSSALAQLKGGVDATAEVQIGAVTTGSDGHATARLTVQNPTADQHDYTISVSFKDSGGSVQDVTVVSVDAVPAGGTMTATARSNRTLSGATAQVTAALRH